MLPTCGLVFPRGALERPLVPVLGARGLHNKSRLPLLSVSVDAPLKSPNPRHCPQLTQHLVMIKLMSVEKTPPKSLSATDPARIFQAGDAFRLAGERALEERYTDLLEFEWLPIPGIVNLAFSVELLLKALLTSRGIEPQRSHNLKSLFEQLEDDDKKAIERVYLEKTQHADAPLFQDLLNEADNIFIEARYFYEKDSEKFIVTGMRVLTYMIHSYVKKVLDL